MPPKATNDLDRAINEYRRQLAPFRENARNRIEKAAGANYGKPNTKKRPVPFTTTTVTILSHYLMSTDPQWLFTTEDRALDESAAEQEGALNAWTRLTNAGAALNEAVVHTIYSGMGIMHVGPVFFNTQHPGDDPGEVRIKSIGFDDWFHDTGADRLEDCTVMGHRYRVPLEVLKQDVSIPQSIRDKLRPSPVRILNERGGRKISALSRDRDMYLEWEEHVELWQVYKVRQRVLETYRSADSGGGLIIGEKLREAAWEGPKRGPYPILGFVPLPCNAVPLAHAAMYEELDDALNDTARKVIYDMRRTKTIGVYQKSAQADARQIAKTPHGETAGLDMPDSFQEKVLGTPNPVLTQLIPQFRQLANMVAGNPDQLAGIAAQTDTATQEKLLSAGAHVPITSMQSKITEWTSRIGRDVAFWLFSDPQLNMRAMKTLPGTQERVPFVMGPDNVEGHPDDYKIEIAPYSHSYRSPQERLGMLQGMIQSFVMPFVQPIIAQGGSFDFDYLLDRVAKLAGLPELSRFVGFYGAPNPNVTDESGGAGGPSSGVREYVRRDRGNTDQGAMLAEQAANVASAAASMNGHAA